MLVWLGTLAALCALGLAVAAPAAAASLWILLVATTPDNFLSNLAGYETVIGAMKAAGLVILLATAIRHGFRRDACNPTLAFLFMFCAGLAHGLYPGLSTAESLRSLIGSAAPFAFGFVRMDQKFTRAVTRATLFAPLFAVAVALALWPLGLGLPYSIEQGAIRLGTAGEPPYLAGFALIAIYAGLTRAVSPTASRGNDALLAANFLILLLTGARAPLALAVILGAITLLAQRRLTPLIAAAGLASLVLLFNASLGFLRVVTLARLGEEQSLSNRTLVWPFFERAIASSPWLGWGAGAGKVIVPINSALPLTLGTNAAHNEYLRIGAEGGVLGLCLLVALFAAWAIRNTRPLPRPQRLLVRGVFLAFAVHSATDNTLIATTASVFLAWACSTFRAADALPATFRTTAPAATAPACL